MSAGMPKAMGGKRKNRLRRAAASPAAAPAPAAAAPAAAPAPAAAVPDDFTQLPFARGLKHEFLQSRMKHVAQVLGGESAHHYHAALARVLPHLAADSHKLAAVGGNAAVPQYIDHTLLKADARSADFAKLCAEAVQHKFRAICVNSSRVAECALMLRGTDVGLAAVVGFPLGAMDPGSKALEARAAVAAGATEIDMVLNVGWLLDGQYARVLADIQGVARECGGKVKVILEVCLLDEATIVDGCILCALAGAEFVKTSTGFSKHGSTPETVDIMKATVGKTCLVKAAGGVRDLATARKYIRAGVSRIGTSSGIAIVQGAAVTKGY
eukprot:TRINITY_DN35489_c0_g1_i1.p1 TRINITY_DN35489_c0_g1~~TRINITY_DN35489_c0_g1_i1.p1  ORF type:complete len:326 (+),score=116.40 TRINITY_DN35489_c0_g1_i1:66-1043(+)